ncbi:ABC transporter permease [Mycoplasma putrefaciens]|uniref:Permease family protein n=1 Tax=Mycoplasma putrefaciens (strain ATCC 15718 / NCTC 10155 / C30 KS-1 / KS-1) TaxID=743965 RepID=A0A7U3ZSX1_MYCPK|nr:ABC transporter permease [Mycoplasma putrefaciens]AEM68908.1 permease family protein [Mycoplasma putrefaciens KS1]
MRNLFLMIKQGMKWIFKLKLQLIIIMLLTFIASTILTISFTTNQRLENEYNTVVNNNRSPEFDSTYNIGVGPKAKPEKNDSLFLPIFDFVKKTWTGLEGSTHNYNLVFNSAYDNTLLTKAVASEDFKKAWISYEGMYDLWDSDVNVSKNQEKFDFAINDAIFNTMVKLLSNKKNESEYNAIRNTLIDKYTNKNPDWYKPFLEKDSKSNWLTFINNTKKYNEIKQKFPEHLKIYNYSYYAFESVSQYLFKTVRFFLDNHQLRESTLKKIMSDKKKTAMFLYEFMFGLAYEKDKPTNEGKNYVIGKDLSKRYSITFERSLSQEGFKNLNVLNKKEDTDEIINKKFEDLIVERGFRGVLRPLVVEISKNGSDRTIDKLFYFSETRELEGVLSNTNKYTQNSQELPLSFRNDDLVQLLAVNADPFANIGKKSVNFFTDTLSTEYTELKKEVQKAIPKQFPITSAFLTHNYLSAIGNGYDLYIRPEVVYVDPTTKKTFRVVDISDTNFTNYAILNGQLPRAPSEITLSKQFARANKIKIGESIKLGFATGLIVTGYATDTYSFFPTSDPKVPLPKSSSGGLVYATRNTIREMLGAQDKGDNNDSSSIFNFFLFKKNSGASLRNVYLDQFSDSTKIRQNINAYGNNDIEPSTFYSQSEFDKSFYSLNWTLYKKASKWYSLTSFLTAIVIAFVTSLAVFFGVYKSIKSNAKQIGILKANGVYARVISTSYLSYAVILTILVIPIGWMIGTMLQVPFIAIFQDYFGIRTDIIAYNATAPLWTFLIFGVILGAFSYLVALLNIRKPTLDIINQTDKWSKPVITDWFNDKVFRTVKFNRVLTFKLAEAGKKPLSLLIGLLIVGTLFISIGIAIPSMALNAKDKYFQNINYSNEYNLTSSLTNSPLGKDSINIWNGPADDKSFKKATEAGVSLDYYDNPNDYTSSIQNTSALPQLIYDISYAEGPKTVTPLKSFVDSYFRNSKNNDLYERLLGWLSYQITIANGRSLSIGSVEQLYSYFFNNDDISKYVIDDKHRLEEANAASEPLTQFAGQLLKILFDAKTNISSDWKEQMLDFLFAYTPTFVKSHLTSGSRKEQLSLGFQIQNIIPDKDQLATVFDPLSNNSKAGYSILGIDKTQKSFDIDSSTKDKTFLSVEAIQQINKVVNQPKGSIKNDIYHQSIKIYDAKTNTLTIPAVLNKTLSAKFNSNKSIFNNISTNNTQLMFKNKNGQFQALPRQAWIYDDTDYANTDYAKQNNQINKYLNSQDILNNYEKVSGNKDQNNLGTDRYYLNPYNLDTNKFTQKQVIDIWSKEKEKQKNNGIVANSPMFGDFIINNKGKILGSFIRPYYQMRNLLLFIPKLDEVNWKEFATYASYWQIYKDPKTVYREFENDLSKEDENTRNKKQPAISLIKNGQVPKSIKNAWSSVLEIKDNTEFLAIRPYDLSLDQANEHKETDGKERRAFDYFNFDSQGKITGVKEHSSESILEDLILKGISHFYRRAVGQRSGVAALLKLENSKVSYVNKDLKIRFKNIGELELYGKAQAIIDSDLANMIFGYDISRSTNYNYNPFDTKNPIGQPGKYFTKYKTTSWKKQNINQAWKETFLGHEDAYTHSPHYYFNTLYSNIEEPLGITSSVSIIADKKIGNTILDITNFSDYKASITNLQFTSEIKQLLDQLAKTAIYVAVIIILSVALAAGLLIMLIADVYISEYKAFMIMLRSMGYTNAEIVDFTLRVTVVISLLVITLTLSAVFGSINILSTALYAKGIVVPIGIKWWSPFISIIIVGSSLFGSLWLSTRSVRKEDVSVAIHANQ